MNFRNTSFLLVLTALTFCTLGAQQFLDETLDYDGEIRKYKIYVPASYDGGAAVPLLFNFHGGNGDIASQVAIADMRPIADTANFIIVYPQALPDPNDDGSANWLHKEPSSIDDVFFVDAMIDAISIQYEIDQSRIYACGYSLGGEFTFELACRLNERIAAVGVVARTMGTAAFDNCAPSHPTGMITILGTDDFVSPYDGLEWMGIQFYLSADDTHAYWVTHNNSSTMATVSQLPDQDPSDGSTVEHYSWADGNGCVAVEHLKVVGGGHDWPGSFGNGDIDATQEIWDYVSTYDIDGLMDCSATTVEEALDETLSVVVYPNPVSDHLLIENDFVSDQVYQIFSSNGQRILSGVINSTITKIDVSALPQNSYILEINNTIFRFTK